LQKIVLGYAQQHRECTEPQIERGFEFLNLRIGGCGGFHYHEIEILAERFPIGAIAGPGQRALFAGTDLAIIGLPRLHLAAQQRRNIQIERECRRAAPEFVTVAIEDEAVETRVDLGKTGLFEVGQEKTVGFRFRHPQQRINLQL
jgi:hypothetical protein